MAQHDLASAIEMVARSDTGRVRGNNEDAVFINAACGLAILADGMGGHNAGEVASNMAITTVGGGLERAFQTQLSRLPGTHDESSVQAAMLGVITRANAAIHQAAGNNPDYAGMGTTLVVARFHDNRLAVAHVGDSRLYRWRGGTLMRLTRDHSVLQERIDSGLISPEQARFSPHRNLVTRALGVEAAVNAEISEHEVLPDDVYLLCSDGLNDMVADPEIAATLTAGVSDLSSCATQLIRMANEHGGRDNVSVILAKVREPFPATPWWRSADRVRLR